VKVADEGREESSYYGYNPHTDVEQITSETGDTRATYGYTAYGSNDDTLFTGVDKPDPVDPTAKEEYNPYRFNAKRWDNSTGMYDMGFRDYNPGLNRFLNLDAYNGALNDLSLGLDPWTSNRYAFTGGNPISGVELDGHAPDHCLYGVCSEEVAKNGPLSKQTQNVTLPQGNPCRTGCKQQPEGTTGDKVAGWLSGFTYATNPFSGLFNDPCAHDISQCEPGGPWDRTSKEYRDGWNSWDWAWEICPEGYNCGVVFPTFRPGGISRSGGVALGSRKEGDLRNFADSNGLTHFLDDTREGALGAVRDAAFYKPDTQLHIVLDGFDEADNPALAFKKAYERGGGNNWYTTEREMKIVGDAVRRGYREWSSITFYHRGGIVDVPLPDFLK
jgi:RHS repeat-associated protein